jgi:hypothetical protein
MNLEAEKREAAQRAATQKAEAEKQRAREPMKSDAALTSCGSPGSVDSSDWLSDAGIV